MPITEVCTWITVACRLPVDPFGLGISPPFVEHPLLLLLLLTLVLA